MPRAKIPGGNMTVHTARKRWAEVREAARSGDPTAMVDAASRFEGIADTMFFNWDQQAVQEGE